MPDEPKTDDQFSDDHPLASPTELAGSTEGAIAAEFAARDAEEALDTDAAGAMTGAAYQEDLLDGAQALPAERPPTASAAGCPSTHGG